MHRVHRTIHKLQKCMIVSVRQSPEPAHGMKRHRLEFQSEVIVSTAAASRGPLAGIKVVEYGDLVTAPYSSKLLADLGASVIKVEAPRTGDVSRTVGPFPDDVPHPERSGMFLYLNTNKRGVTLNLAAPRGREIFDQLIASADLLIENVPPAESDGLGLSPDRLSNVNPKLLHVSITPFGHEGPYASYKGYGLNVAAMSGVVLAVGDPERPPLPLPDFLQDFFTGTVGAMAGLLSLTGKEQADLETGDWIDLSAMEAWGTLQMGIGIVGWLFNGRRTLRKGRRSTGGPYPHTLMHAKDGDLRMMAMTKREWVRFVGVMGNPEWAADPRFQDRIKMNELYADELDALIEPWVAARTKSELFQIMYDAGVPFTPVKDFEEVLHDPQLRARDFFKEVDQPGVGSFEVPGPPYRFKDEPLPEHPTPAPSLGQHNREVYEGELGIENAELVRLYQAGVI